MTKNDVLTMLAVLQTAYPYFYSKKSDEEMLAIAQIWEKKFANDDVRIVTLALDKIIECEEYPPSIATVKNYISRLEQYATNSDTLVELWDKFMYACANSSEYSEDAFHNMPQILKMFVGSNRQLRRYAKMSEIDLERYVRSEFSKEIPTLRERENFERTITPEIKAIMAETANNKLTQSNT